MKSNLTLIWVCLIGTMLLVLFGIVLIALNGHVQFESLKIEAEAFINLSATFMAICAAIMLGAQIYASYSKAKSEREYNMRITEFENWVNTETAKIQNDLKSVKATLADIIELKYYLNDVIASIHARDERFLEGIVDVIRNLILLIENPSLNSEKKEEKIGFAVYCIAKNLKRYKSDKIFVDEKTEDFYNFFRDWSKHYTVFKSITNDSEHGELRNKMARLNAIINKLREGLSNRIIGFNVSIERGDNTFLNGLAGD